MTNPIIKIINAENNEIIEREMNAAELKQYDSDQAGQVAAQAEAETKATAKAALFEKLGISAEEASLLLS
jgi:hypothetical protein